MGIDMQENMRAGAIMIYCGEEAGGEEAPASPFPPPLDKLLEPLALGTTDTDLITGTETPNNITQSETFAAANPDNPLQIVVAYNDSRGRNQTPINISGCISLHRWRQYLRPPYHREWSKPFHKYPRAIR
jgi:hypothetical protein